MSPHCPVFLELQYSQFLSAAQWSLVIGVNRISLFVTATVNWLSPGYLVCFKVKESCPRQVWWPTPSYLEATARGLQVQAQPRQLIEIPFFKSKEKVRVSLSSRVCTDSTHETLSPNHPPTKKLQHFVHGAAASGFDCLFVILQMVDPKVFRLLDMCSTTELHPYGSQHFVFPMYEYSCSTPMWVGAHGGWERARSCSYSCELRDDAENQTQLL